MRRYIVTACLAAAALGAIAPVAGAQDPFRAIIDDWRADGQVTPCKYTPAQLNATLNLPGDIEQYAPGLIDQIQNALQTQAAGGCDKKPAEQPVEEAAPAPAPVQPPSAPTPEPVVEVAEPPAPEAVRKVVEAVAKAPAPPVTASGSLRGVEAPAPVWLLGALLAAAALAGLAALVAWFFGWSAERFTRPLTAATAEAGGRGADVFAEFRDWLRLGR